MSGRPPFICSGVGARPQSGPSAPGRIPVFKMISHPFREVGSRAEICKAHAKRYELLQQRMQNERERAMEKNAERLE